MLHRPICVCYCHAFAMKSYILKPYTFRDQPTPNVIINYRLSRAGRILENVFGVTAINLDLTVVTDIVLAVCAPHNFLISTTSLRANYFQQGLLDTGRFNNT